jgi:hypothetical protein
MSWGHAIFSASERERSRRGIGTLTAMAGDPMRCGLKCANPVVYRLRYNYITGRAGRVGVSERCVCEEHGRKFAAKYGLTAPDPTIPGEDSRRRVTREAFIKEATGT